MPLTQKLSLGHLRVDIQSKKTILFKWRRFQQLLNPAICMTLRLVTVQLVARVYVIHAQARVPEVVQVVLAVLAVAVVVDVMVVVLGVQELVPEVVPGAEMPVLVRVQDIVPEVVPGVLDAERVVAIVVVVVLEVVLEAAQAVAEHVRAVLDVRTHVVMGVAVDVLGALVANKKGVKIGYV